VTVTLTSWSTAMGGSKFTMISLSVACQARIAAEETTALTSRSTPSRRSSARGFAMGLKRTVEVPEMERALKSGVTSSAK
jgi:hypothetical protein